VTKQSYKKFAPYLMLICLGFSGCVALENLDQLNELGDYSREKDAQHRNVKTINDHYDVLIKAIAKGNFSDYKDASSLVHAFGEPILKKDLGNGTQRWLYRYAIYRLAKDKVYVYFDRSGKILKWEKLPCQSFL